MLLRVDEVAPPAPQPDVYLLGGPHGLARVHLLGDAVLGRNDEVTPASVREPGPERREHHVLRDGCP